MEFFLCFSVLSFSPLIITTHCKIHQAREVKENEGEDEKQKKEMQAFLQPLPPVSVRNSSVLATEMTKEEGVVIMCNYSQTF